MNTYRVLNAPHDLQASITSPPAAPVTAVAGAAFFGVGAGLFAFAFFPGAGSSETAAATLRFPAIGSGFPALVLKVCWGPPLNAQSARYLKRAVRSVTGRRSSIPSRPWLEHVGSGVRTPSYDAVKPGVRSSEICSDSGELPRLASFVAVIYYSLPEGGKLPGSPFI